MTKRRIKKMILESENLKGHFHDRFIDKKKNIDLASVFIGFKIKERESTIEYEDPDNWY